VSVGSELPHAPAPEIEPVHAMIGAGTQRLVWGRQPSVRFQIKLIKEPTVRHRSCYLSIAPIIVIPAFLSAGDLGNAFQMPHTASECAH